MAAAVVVMLIAASLFMDSTNCVVPLKEPSDVIHVAGKVLCQDCTQGYNEWIQGAKPLKGSKVSLTCMDERKRVMHYESDETDEEGQFEMIVNKYSIKGKELKGKLCSVSLVSSPDPACNILTNFGGGQSGVKLLTPTLIYRDIIKYTLAPFYYTTPMCHQLDTNEDRGSNY